MAPGRELTIGVDFGTTVSSAGVFDRGQVQLVHDGGKTAIPSVVHFPTHGDPVVGADAERRAVFSPKRVVSSSKRLLGLALGDALVRRYAALAPYTVAPAPAGRLMLGLEDGNQTVDQIATIVLSHLRRAAERRFGVSIRNVVLTVPASAGEELERALTRAARAARLKVVELIPDPVAGALGLGVHLEPSQRRLLICDFGGGSFDVAAITCGNGHLDVIATAGDPNLGGDDFSDALVGALAIEELGHNLFDAIADADSYHHLLARLEPLKRLLSVQDSVRIRVREAYVSRGRRRDLDRVLTRTWAEDLWSPLVERAIDLAARTLDHLDWSEDDIDGVVLLGGVANAPIVRRRFAERFRTLIEVSPRDAETAVVRGAVLRSSQFGARARRATRTVPPPPPRDPNVPIVAEPNMAATARIVPIVL